MSEIFINFLVGLGAGFLGLLTRSYAHESYFLSSHIHQIFSIALFVAGLVCLYFLLGAGHAWEELSLVTLLTALAVSVGYRLHYHRLLKRDYEKAFRSSRFSFLRPVEMRSGYFESKMIDDSDNAWTTRFGHTTIGRKSDRGIWANCSGVTAGPESNERR